MKEASEVFKSIRYAKVAKLDKPHKSTDEEEHGTVGEKEYEDQVKHVKKMAGVPVSEDAEYIEEKNAPTNPSLWSRAKALARSKFDVYPSAYANGWASKWYKSKGGGWKSVSEEVVEEGQMPKTWHDVDKKLGKAVDKMSQAEKVAKGFAHPDTLKKKPKQQGVAEEVEQLEEMPGANMDTRAVHSHLKKHGWSLSRSSGGHDVFTHPDAEHHIAVPRHRQLKAPLVKGILKQSIVREAAEQDKKDKPPFEGPYKKVSSDVVTDKSGAKHTAMSRVRHLARMAARRQAGIKEQMEPEDSPEKTDTPAKRSLSKTASMVKDLAIKAKNSKKEKPDTFQPEPELSSQIVKT